MVVKECHRLSRLECTERAEDGGMAKALGDTAGVEGVEPIGASVGIRLVDDGEGFHGRFLGLM
jgi:hypothetical protein